MKEFESAYKSLNTRQKEAVDTIDGPVMVVAGPGTGKTQILALRIANILSETDIGASGILCLTFTNSGVRAMRERLHKYIGGVSNEVKVSTFHSFAQKIVETNFEILDLDRAPELLDEQKSVLLFDQILHNNDWQHIRPRNNPSQYFHDLKSLISLLKRENIKPEEFSLLIDQEIDSIKKDPSNISTRGESKGNFKKETEKKIESLERTKESVTFYDLYEKEKKTKLLMDYDDVLVYALFIINNSEDIRSTIQEENQYILVDEHQDSSGIQNELLKSLWGDVELPNIFVVGDDRQLIYGFGGASISYFENFKHLFGKAHLISLVDNYRSTQNILDTASSLLTSTLATDALKSNTKDNHNIDLYECSYERDEILLAGRIFEDKIKSGTNPKDCALLVPKNRNVRSAIRVLADMGIPVSTNKNTSFFDLDETSIFNSILKIINDPYDAASLSKLLFSPQSEVGPIEAHQFIRSIKVRNLSIKDFITYESTPSLFSGGHPVSVLGNKLKSLIELNKDSDIYTLVQNVGQEFFLDKSKEHKSLIRNIEVVRTYLHLAISQLEKDPHIKLGEYIEYIDRLKSYNHHIPLAILGKDEGVNVMTLHGSKGLEFEVVHIAHMNENTFMSGKRRGFTLPESVENKIEEKDELTAKRELFVAITRAKKFCSISYALESLSGSQMDIAHIISGIDDKHFVKKDFKESIEIISKDNPNIYVENNSKEESVGVKELAEILSSQYEQKNISVTLLNNFFECPWKWYFNSFLQVPTPKTESLYLGSVVHSVIENVLKNKGKITNKAVEDFIEIVLDKELIYEKNLRSRIEKKAQTILSNWLEIYYPNIQSDFITERSVAYYDPNFPHLKMYGKIDLTEKIDDTIIVTDFKTGSSKTKGSIEKRDEEGRMSSLLRQLAMYSYLLNGQNVTESKLLFLEQDPKDKNSIYSTQITKEEIGLLVQDIKDYDEMLKTGNWTTRNCYNKGYSSNPSGGECEHCKLANSLYRG